MLQFIKSTLLFSILTILTQTGGFVYLVYKLFKTSIAKRVRSRWSRIGVNFLVFSVLFLANSFLITPSIAPLFGRVHLPVTSSTTNWIKPATFFTCIANRHYVRPELYKSMQAIAASYKTIQPDAQLIYLDANFPFWDGFPLLPHLSHNDGKKLDISFIYRNKESKKLLKEAPGFLGYGHCEAPQAGEFHQPEACKKKGYWQYNVLYQLTDQSQAAHFQFDEKANQQLIRIITKQKSIRKLFIEPHLKVRLGLGNNIKVRFHGCQAVRHDDHIHLQL